MCHYKSISLLLLCSILLGFTSCRKELGNYKYQDINECVINGIDSSYSILRGFDLKISPELIFSQDRSKDTSKYSYQWFVVDDRATPSERTDIAKTRQLNWTVTLPVLSYPYRLYYRVTEISTGQSWQREVPLSVNTNIADGWLVLNEINNKGRLDYFNYLPATNEFQYYKDILALQASVKQEGKPAFVYFYYRRDVFSGVAARSVVLGTDQETTIINTRNNSFNPYIDLSKATMAYFPPPYYAVTVKAAGSQSYMLDNLGRLNFEAPSQATGYGTMINKTLTGEKITISPFIAESYFGGNNTALMYDVVNKRFYLHNGLDVACAVPVTESTLFDPGHVKMDLMYLSRTPALGQQVYALFKNAAGKVFLARISLDGTTFVELAFDEVTATDILQAKLFAIDPVEGYLMYTTGNKVYRYNPFDRSVKMVLDAGNRSITVLKYQQLVYDIANPRYLEYASKLIVGSYDPAAPQTSGKLELYTVPNLNGPLRIYKTFEGLGKIVDVSYRE